MTVSREEKLMLAERFEKSAGLAAVFNENERSAISAALRAAAELDHRTSGEPVAWEYELATRVVHGDDRGAIAYDGFDRRVSFEKPNVPAASVRNLKALVYASSLPDHQSAASHSQEVWRHKVRGSTVTIFAKGRAQASTRPIEDMDPITIYNHDGEWWVRRVEEFEDGRFERVASQAGSEASGGAEHYTPPLIELALEREEKYLHGLIDDEAVGSVMHGDIEGAFHRLNEAVPRPAPEQAAQGDVAETALDQSGSSKP